MPSRRQVNISSDCLILNNKNDRSSSISSQNCHSLHETQDLKACFKTKKLGDASSTSSLTSNINLGNLDTSLTAATKTSLLGNLRFTGGTASAKVKWKKASFSSLPLCIKRNDASDEEDRQINEREQELIEKNELPKSQLFFLNSTKNYAVEHKSENTKNKAYEDPVEEAIRSLESFGKFF